MGGGRAGGALVPPQPQCCHRNTARFACVCADIQGANNQEYHDWSAWWFKDAIADGDQPANALKDDAIAAVSGRGRPVAGSQQSIMNRDGPKPLPR